MRVLLSLVLSLPLIAGFAPPVLAQTAAMYQQTQYKGREIGNLTGDVYYARMDDYVSVFMVTREGIVLVEPIGTEFATWLKAELARRFNVPVRYVIYSHSHWDHASGASVYADTARTVGQQNMIRSLAMPPAGSPLPDNVRAQDVNGNGRIERGEARGQMQTLFDLYDADKDGVVNGAEATRGPLANVRPPDVTFSDRFDITLGGKRVEVIARPIAHADDNAIVRFVDGANVLFASDWVTVHRLPFGAIDDEIAMVKAVEALDFEHFVCSHGGLGKKADVSANIRYREELRDAVAKAIAAGQTLDQAQASVRMDAYKDWDFYEQQRPLNVAGMYRALQSARPPAAPAQPRGAADWPMYNRDLAGTRFSPLTGITTDNVSTLSLAWSYKLGKDRTAGTISGGSEFTPLVIDGVMYAATSDRVVALEPETGREIWQYRVPNGVPSRRSVAFWAPDSGATPRIFFTAERTLISLSARTGEPVADFNGTGQVDMGAPYNSAPTVYKNLLIVGTNGSPGGVRAFDARNGRRVWDFRSVPQPGDAGNDTWKNGSWKDRAGAYSWAFSQTLDAERGLLYVAIEAPGPSDYWGADRPGDNLYGNSIVALDALTGKVKWHFQAVHHDLWDYDLPSAPVLLDATIGGRPTPILAFAAKTGYMYILNRVTGQPIFGMEERRVSKSDVPGEVTSPTQPIPVKPPPIARTSFAPGDIVTAADTSDAHAAFCRGLMERSGGLRNDGPFTPYLYHEAGAPPRSTIVFPGSIGGANWGGVAADPTLGYVFVNTSDEASIGWVEKSPDGARVPYRRNSIVGPTSRFQWAEGDPRTGNIMGGDKGWLCQRPPWGNLLAVNAATGDIVWKVALGVTDELPEGRQATGRLNLGGPMVTAGGLVFIGATNDRRFRAFDARTGRELWATKLAMSAHAIPMTYQGRDGRQYVAITAAGRSALDDQNPNDDDALMVYALPRQ